MKAIPYGRQSITQADIDCVVDTLKSDFLTQGPKIAEFEQAFAKYVGAKYAVLVGNATEALHISALSLGVGSSSVVLTTPISFVASANCIAYCGGKVDFVDIDPDTALMDLNELETKLSSKPLGYYSGVIPVDFAGLPVDLERLRSIANKYNLWIIEDACHAPGGYFIDSTGHKQFCGNGQFADISVFSFHPVKHIACGEGGIFDTSTYAGLFRGIVFFSLLVWLGFWPLSDWELSKGLGSPLDHQWHRLVAIILLGFTYIVCLAAAIKIFLQRRKLKKSTEGQWFDRPDLTREELYGESPSNPASEENPQVSSEGKDEQER